MTTILSSWNPFAWFSQPPMTDSQIRLYDLNRGIEDVDYQLFENMLEKINLENKRRGLREQEEYIQHRELNNTNSLVEEQMQKTTRLFAFGSNH